MKVKDYIDSVLNDSSRRLLVHKDTGQIWGVDEGSLRDRGYPEGNWVLLEDITKEELIVLLYTARGVETIS